MEQGRKLLVLYDKDAHFFFVGAWTEWQRVHQSASVTDPEENSTAKTVDVNEYKQMVEVCSASLVKAHLHPSLEWT
eukprot:4945170-Pleurochrysis_carterae.AAC.1